MADGQEVLAGIIAAETDPPGLSRDGWRDVIETEPMLRGIEGQDAADIVDGGRVIGRIRWSSTAANELDVYGEQQRVSDVAWDVAAALGGRFVDLAELTRC